MTLYIICGHGAGDPGACGCGYSEAERVRALGAKLKELGGDSVELLDTSRNWYQDAGICSLSIGRNPLIELHMDGATSSDAKGGHVIICADFEPDEWDNALAEFIGEFFPGRSTLIAKRSDLANPNRAASKGINYRLIECGFVTNAGDVTKFSNEIDALASGILGCFGIGAESASSEPAITASKSVDELANEVIQGVWGNGDARRNALEGAGYNYQAIQTRVNEILADRAQETDIDTLAKAVIRGDYGNGEERKRRLGSYYNAVQARVNELLT